MQSVITNGIVLRRSNFGEADRLLVLFTEKLGKVSAVANGSRKNSSKFGGHLEPGAVVQFELAPGKSLYTIRAAKALTKYQFNDLVAMQQLFIWLELIDKLIHSEVHSEELWQLISRGVKMAAEAQAPYNLACAELELYSTTGYELVLDRCVVGQESLNEKNQYFISAIHGGIVCKEHINDHNAVSITRSAIKVLRLVQERQGSVLVRLTIPPSVAQELIAIARLQRDTILERSLRSAELQI